MRLPTQHKYTNLDELNNDRDAVAWYWRLIALIASWMILGGYLIFPAAFDQDPHLRFSKGALTIIIVTLMTAGYSFTVLLCFACPNPIFHSESVFLPALTSSSLGLLTVLWSFASSTRYQWTSAAVIATVLSAAAAVIYGLLLLWSHRKITRIRAQTKSRVNNMWGSEESSYYKNFIANMYPSARKNPDGIPLSDEDRINHQMALLLMKSDPGPSPDASQHTFRIDLPVEEREHELMGHDPLQYPSQTQRPIPRHIPIQVQQYYDAHQQYQHQHQNQVYGHQRSRSASINDRAPTQNLWERAQTTSRGRADSNLSVGDATRGRSEGRVDPGRPRALSREERRQQIELGTIHP